MADRSSAKGDKPLAVDPLAPGDVAAHRTATSLAESGAPVDPSTSAHDDDFIPPDIFEPVAWNRGAPQLDTGDADFVPPDIFTPAEISTDQNPLPSHVEQAAGLSVAPAVDSASLDFIPPDIFAPAGTSPDQNPVSPLGRQASDLSVSSAVDSASLDFIPPDIFAPAGTSPDQNPVSPLGRQASDLSVSSAVDSASLDFIPPDIFATAGRSPDQNPMSPLVEQASDLSVAPAVDSASLEFIQPDIVAPAGTAPDQNPVSPLVEQAPDLSVAPAVSSAPLEEMPSSAERGRLDDVAVPVDVTVAHNEVAEQHEPVERPQPPASKATPVAEEPVVPVPVRPAEKTGRRQPPTPWFKPFPLAPPIRPLSFVVTPEARTPVADPEPSVVAPAAPPPASPPKQTVTRPTMSSTSIRHEPPRTGTGQTPSGIDQFLRLAASLGASTLYLSSNTRPSVRLDGAVQPLANTPSLTPTEIDTMLVSLVLTHNAASRGAIAIREWSFEVPDVGRVRCMRFDDGRGPGAVFRIAAASKAGEDAAALTLDIQTLAVEREGLVIVAGPRASGKQSAMNALVDLISRTRHDHVIAVQREVNGVPDYEGGVVSRREAREGLDDILSCARAALHENPDVLVLQEVRSAPLMNLALDAAASGQLVIAGFTAPSASSAIERIIDLYLPEEARRIQLSLSQHLRAIVGQVLVPKIGGGRVAAREVLLNTQAVSSVLAAGNSAQLRTALEAAGRHLGMPSLNDALVELVNSGAVSPADAYRHAADPIGFLDNLKRQGMDTSFAHLA